LPRESLKTREALTFDAPANAINGSKFGAASAWLMAGG
jgi:hypothetical protein